MLPFASATIANVADFRLSDNDVLSCIMVLILSDL